MPGTCAPRGLASHRRDGEMERWRDGDAQSKTEKEREREIRIFIKIGGPAGHDRFWEAVWIGKIAAADHDRMSAT